MEDSPKLRKVAAVLRDPTCGTFREGTVEKWLCMMTRTNNWTFLQCFTEGRRHGFSPQSIYEGLKKVVWDDRKVEEAYRQMMLQGDVPLPEWFYGSCWYDYCDTCLMTDQNWTSPNVMDWWINSYLVEPQFGIRAGPRLKRECKTRFLTYVSRPPRKPLVEKVKDLFNTYRTQDFMPR